MQDYYDILGVPSTASGDDIRKAYKKLALIYHPDRNPGDIVAEEKFKLINEAYQTLSDPIKKNRYDFLREYGTGASALFDTVEHQRRYERPRTYPPYARYYSPDQGGQFTQYKVDKKYFRDLFVTLGLFFLISTLIVGFYEFQEYMADRQILEIRQQNHIVLQEARANFVNGAYREALDKVSTLSIRYPYQSTYRKELKGMMTQLADLAQTQFDAGQYVRAAQHYEILKDFEEPMNLNTWYRIAMCHYKAKDFRKAIHSMDYILMRDRQNIPLLLQIASIYDNDLNQPEQALGYYDEAKLLFKKFQSTSYGEAFELIMPASETPDIYFELFVKRADLHMRLDNYEEAIKDCNWAILLRPERVAPYLMRARAFSWENVAYRACQDWESAAALGSHEAERLLGQHCP